MPHGTTVLDQPMGCTNSRSRSQIASSDGRSLLRRLRRARRDDSARLPGRAPNATPVPISSRPTNIPTKARTTKTHPITTNPP